ncbi:MAG: hypothetical protein AB2708_17835 [Candidatus Thiodiazotropha taylori]
MSKFSVYIILLKFSSYLVARYTKMANNQEEQLSGISHNDISFSQSSGLFLPLPRDQQMDEQQLDESNSVVFSDESRYQLSGFSSNCSEATDP